MTPHRKRKKERARWDRTPTVLEKEKARRDAAFAAIRALYAEAVTLWPFCKRGTCRRHKVCAGDRHAGLVRAWPQLTAAAQDAACAAVEAGGPRRLQPATAEEQRLRHYPPSNFVHL